MKIKLLPPPILGVGALISVSALFGSCQKEQQELTRLNLIAEGFQNNKATKLADDGSNTFWGS